jgi:ParB family chromosome partitioning protein
VVSAASAAATGGISWPAVIVGTSLERAEHLARRKEIYETLHPETKAGIAQALSMNRALGRDVGNTVFPTFTKDAAEKTGLSQMTIRRDIQIATRILSGSP